MKRWGWIATGLAALGLSAAVAAAPNVVFFLVDDLGWTDLACFGSSFYETPNCDRLAREGVRFTSGYAACPVCSPTRASIMTGKYPARMATTDYFGAAQPDTWNRPTKLLPASYIDHLPLEETTLAEELKTADYRCSNGRKLSLPWRPRSARQIPMLPRVDSFDSSGIGLDDRRGMSALVHSLRP